MSEIEDAPTTIARLLKTRMRVTKDNGSLAAVKVSGEFQNSDALKECDGQVTVGLAECTDQKVELSGKIRRRTSIIRVNVWATEASNTSDSGRVMRNKMVEEVNRVVRESRTKPNETLYDFLNSSQAAQTCKAFKDTTEAAPGDLSWTELPNAQYQQLWYSDDDRCQVDCVESGKCAVLLFRFKIDSRENTVKKLVLAFEGYGAAPSGNGITLKVYNHNEENWQNTQVGAVSGNDETITLTLLSNIADYITDAGYVWFLARTSNASNGILPATIFCNYVSCLAAVNGITYCDLVSYRNLDRLDVKPFILNTELVLKSWFFENIGV